MIKFEIVEDKFRRVNDVFTDVKGKKHTFPKDIKLPQRATAGSSGYDFFLAEDIDFFPNKITIVPTDIKAIMPNDVELQIRIRSSLAIKDDLQIVNSPATIDSDYANNKDNGGNIMIAIVNRSGVTYKAKAGERIAQGIFSKYLTTTDDVPVNEIRTGGIGSTSVKEES